MIFINLGFDNMEKVCDISDVSKGSISGFTVKGHFVLIANVEGTFYAVDAVCPHEGGYLPTGDLKDNIIVCPVHGAQFDVTNGKLLKDVSRVVKMATGRGASDLNSYVLSEEDGSLSIDI